MSLPDFAGSKRLTIFAALFLIFCIALLIFGCGGGGGGSSDSEDSNDQETVDTSFLNLGTPGEYSGNSSLSIKDTTFELAAAEGGRIDAQGAQITLAAPARTYSVGDVVIGDETSRFAKKIVSVTELNGETVLGVEPAYLEDIFDQGRVEFKVTPDWSQGEIASRAALQKPFDQYFTPSTISRKLDGSAIDSYGGINLDDTSLFHLFIDYDEDYEQYKIDWTKSSILGETVENSPNDDIEEEEEEEPVEDAVEESKFTSEGELEAKIVEGQLNVVPTVDGYYDIALDGLTSAFCQMDMLMTFNAIVEITANGVADFEYTRKLLPKIKVPITIPGPPPVYLDVEIEIPAAFVMEAHVDGMARFEYSSQYALQVVMTYDRSNGYQSRKTWDEVANDKAVRLEAVGSIDAKLSLKPRVTVKLYKLAGPFIELEPYIRTLLTIELVNGRLDWTPDQDDLYLGITGGVGLAVELFSLSREWRTPNLFDLYYPWDIVSPGDYTGPQDAVDSDSDGVVDSLDLCPFTPEDETANADGCADSQLSDDADGDGVPDDDDQCPETPSGESVDMDGCSGSQTADGLVAYYPFNGNANDVSGYENHGTESDNFTYTSGVSGQAANFDGNDYITFSSNPLANIGTGSFSYSIWVNASNSTSQSVILFGNDKRGTLTSEEMAGLIVAPHSPGARINAHSGDTLGNSSDGYVQKAINLNEWIHVAAVYADQTLKLYVNGERVLCNDSSPLQCNDYIPYNYTSDDWNNMTFGTGKWDDSFRSYFHGSLDEVRIYNRALTEEEIIQIYRGSD